MPRRIAIILLGLIASAAPAEDWPTFMRDNQRSGVSSESLRPPLSLNWIYRSPFPPAQGWSLPVNGYGARKNKPNVSHDDAFRVIAAGDSCFFCSSAENKVVAMDAVTGETRWEVFTDAAPRLAPVYWQGNLYVGADDGVFRCLDAAEGTLRWKVDAAPNGRLMLGYGRFSSLWPIRSAGIVDQGIVYFTAGLFPQHGVYLYAVRASDGDVLWREDLGRGGLEAVCPQGHILASPDSLWLTSRVAPTRWSKADGSPISFSTPFPEIKDSHEYRFYNGGAEAKLLDGRKIVYGQACMLGYDPDVERKDKWGKPQRGKLMFHWFGARQMLFHERTAYVATDEHLLAVEQTRLGELAQQECRDYELAYKRLRIGSYLDHLDRYDQLVRQYGEDNARAREIENGPLKWGRENWERWPAESAALFQQFATKCDWMIDLVAKEALILAGDTLYAGGEDGVYALHADTGKRLWAEETGSRVRGLAVANGRLYVSTIDGCVRCFSRREWKAAPNRHQPPPFQPRELAAREKSLLDAAAEQVATKHGYALLVGDDAAPFAVGLAKRTDLRIEIVAAHPSAVDRMRRTLAKAKLYGGRVCVRAGETRDYAPYLFDLVVVLPSSILDEDTGKADELVRLTKPCGGVVLFSKDRDTTARSLSEGCRHSQLLLAHASGLDERATSRSVSENLQELEIPAETNFLAFRRGRLRDSQDWTHNYATAGNTYCSEDPLVRGPLGVLWYGEPGPQKRIERHATPPMPLVAHGVMFTIGYDLVMAYDVYNGVRLWEREIPGATRTSLPINTSNLVADDDGLFVVIDDRECWRLDARSGQIIQVYRPPEIRGDSPSAWAWIAHEGNLLFGSQPDWDSGRRQPKPQTSHTVFALRVASGEPAWTYRGREIDHDGIAVAEGCVFFVDRGLSEQEARQAPATTVVDNSVANREATDRRGKVIEPDLRKLVALDAATGRIRWQLPWDMTDITLDDTVVQGRGGVACMVKDGVLVVHGTGSLGHPHREFLAGEFARRAIFAFDAATGDYLWGGRKGYRKRPIIVGNHVYAEPFAWHLRTGEIKTKLNPLSGQPQVFDFHRGYIGCGHLLGSASTLFGASGGIAYCNLDEQTGFTPFTGMALACGSCAVPAGGVYAVPEGRSGCTCDVPIHTSIAFFPNADEEAWSVGTVGGLAETLSLPVKHVSVNLGAPGYRQDHDGNLWIAYPARIASGMIGQWLPSYQHSDEMCYRLDDRLTKIAETALPWVFRSGYQHDKPLRFRLTADDGPTARYTIRLYFAEPEDLAVGDRVFSVRIQGQTVLEDFDVILEAGKPRRALIREFNDVKVDGELSIELIPSAHGKQKPPMLCGFQALRQDG